MNPLWFNLLFISYSTSLKSIQTKRLDPYKLLLSRLRIVVFGAVPREEVQRFEQKPVRFQSFVQRPLLAHLSGSGRDRQPVLLGQIQRGCADHLPDCAERAQPAAQTKLLEVPVLAGLHSPVLPTA